MVEDVVTDVSSYAPLLTKTQYELGGTLYWRVAAVDEERNVGAFTQVRQIRLAERMSLKVSPRPTRGRFSRVVVTLKNPAGEPVRGATVRAAGAGVRGRAARTSRAGKATLRLRPTRRGTLVLRATKAGFQPTSYAIKIR
jgi:Carboxypeptidase regulatory-like domain